LWKVFNFCGLIFGLLLHSAKSLQKVGIPAQIVKLLLSFLFAVYLLLPPITQVFIIGAFLMLCVHVISFEKKKLSTDNSAVDNILFAENEVVLVHVAGGPETIMHLWVF